jgi:hypothetical protein
VLAEILLLLHAAESISTRAQLSIGKISQIFPFRNQRCLCSVSHLLLSENSNFL